MSENISSICNCAIYDAIPHSQHQLHSIKIKPIITPIEQPVQWSFNLRKMNRDEFKSELDTSVDNVGLASQQKYNEFSETVRSLARMHIPCGCHTKNIPGFYSYMPTFLMEYQRLYSSDPFSSNTIEAGQILFNQLNAAANCNRRWWTLLTKNNSKRGWQMLS